MTKYLINVTLTANSYNIPVDFSCLSYPMALGLLRGKVLVKNCLQLDPNQADAKFISLMSESEIYFAASAFKLLNL